MPIATLPTGRIEGVTLDEGVVRFMNVPFAAPPFGNRRFVPAEAHPPWRGVWDGTRPGPTPPQRESWSPLHALGAAPGHIPGDDILNLSVWTPSLTGNAPVAVYIHGGGFREGNGSLRMYDGSAFARDGIVLVTINYRVGAEGFMLLQDGHRNLGFDDQLAALRWVRASIAAFGGDPERVTIFGQSAGGASVANLVARPDAHGLFRAAINQSGPIRLSVTEDSALEFTDRIAAALRVRPTRSGFLGVDPDALIEAVEAVVGDISRVAERDGMRQLAPVLDPDRVPWHRTGDLDDAFQVPVPVLAGFTAEERLLFDWQDTRQPTANDTDRAWSEAGFDAGTIRARLGAADPTLDDRALLRKAREFALFMRPTTDWLGAARRNGVAAWGYEFGWQTNAQHGDPGAYHVLDVPFVFDRLGSTAAIEMTGDDAPQHLADAVHGEWVAFIRDGVLDRPQYEGVRSMRWFDTTTREQRRNTTAVVLADHAGSAVEGAVEVTG